MRASRTKGRDGTHGEWKTGSHKTVRTHYVIISYCQTSGVPYSTAIIPMLHLAPLQLSSRCIARGKQYKSRTFQEDSFNAKLIMDISTQRSKPKFPHNGCLYVFDKATKDGNKKMWRCDQKNRGCKARLHTDSTTGVVVNETGEHNHGSDAAGVEVAAVVTGMKRRASDTQEGIYQILLTFH